LRRLISSTFSRCLGTPPGAYNRIRALPLKSRLLHRRLVPTALGRPSQDSQYDNLCGMPQRGSTIPGGRHGHQDVLGQTQGRGRPGAEREQELAVYRRRAGSLRSAGNRKISPLQRSIRIVPDFSGCR
jgi:hypothetical protein